MDFHSLPRKQLQTLCKKNKIPANITNVAMADALAALEQVEGLDDILNSIEADAGTPNVQCRTAGRASSQRKAARAEAEGSTVKVSASARPLRGANANVPPVTPAVGRRRATAVSTRRTKEVEMVEEVDDKNDAPKTIAAASVGRRRTTSRSVCTTKIETPSGTSVQRAYSTRRSVRLLESGLSKMSLIDTEDTGSHQAGDSCDTEKGSSLLTDSSVVSENTQEFEVCSSQQNTQYECQSRVSGSDVKLVSVTENNAVVEPHALDEAEPEKINCLEMGTEPNASAEAGSEPLPDLEGTCDSSELETENKECVGAYEESFPVEASTDAFVEVTGLEIADMEPDNVSVDLTDQGSLKEIVELMDEKISPEGDDNEDKKNETEEDDESNDLSLLQGSSDSCDKSDDQGSEPVREEIIVDIVPSEISEDALVGVTDQGTATLTPEVADEDVTVSDAATDINEYNTEDALVGVTDQDTATLTLEVADEDVTVSDAPTDINEFNTEDALVGVTDKDTATLTLEVADEDVAVSDAPTDINEYNTGDVNQDIKDETEHLNLACGNMVDEDYQYPITVDEKYAKESASVIGSEGVPELESISNSVGELQEEELKEAKPEHMEAGRHNAHDVTEAQAEESEETVAGQVSVESASGPLDGELSCKSNVPTEGEVVSQDVTAITDQDTNVSSDVPVQSVVSNSFKENVTSDDLHKKTMGELKRMLKGLTLGGEKSNCNKTISKEVDKKRTALQVLPQNQMTSGEAQLDD